MFACCFGYSPDIFYLCLYVDESGKVQYIIKLAFIYCLHRTPPKSV